MTGCRPRACWGGDEETALTLLWRRLGLATIDTHQEADIVARLRAAGCVFAADEARLLTGAARTPGELAAMVERRVAGLPLEHVVGWVEFCGLRIAVDPGVFVPRRRTELLVRMAASAARSAATSAAGPVVVDLACGCGAVGVALAASLADGPDGSALADGPARAGIELHAVDVEPAAVACARRNLAPLGGHAYLGDLFDPLPVRLRGRVDVLVANVPYVPTDAVDLMPPEARLHEPRVALDGGTDGLDVLRRVARGARDWLAPGGYTLMEVGEDQVPAALRALADSGLAAQVHRDDDLEATVVAGRR